MHAPPPSRLRAAGAARPKQTVRATCTVVLSLVVAALAAPSAGCATRGAAMRDVGARELGCPSSAVQLTRVEGRIYRATGCGSSVEVACYDPHESTGAAKGWADGATAGDRIHCEALLARPSSPRARAPKNAPFDRTLAATLLAASADRARACAERGGPTVPGRAVITIVPNGSVASVEMEPPYRDTEAGQCVAAELSRVSLPAFAGEAVVVGKRFELGSGAAPGAPAAGTTNL